MMYTLARLFIFLTPLFLIAGCNQNNEVTNQANTDQSTENTKASVEELTTQPLKARDLSLGFFNGKGGKKVRYLFRRQGARSRDPNPEAWQLVQELTDEQTVDMKTGKVTTIE